MAALGSSELTARPELDSALRHWLREGRQLLLVEGPPGSGKTAWAEMLGAAGDLRGEDGTALARLMATHRCQRHDERSADGVLFLQNLANQFARRESRFAANFATRSAGKRNYQIHITQDLRGSRGASAIGMQIQVLNIQGLSTAELLADLLAPLDDLLADPGPDWLVLIDAPDEPAKTELADLLTALGDMPRRLRWLITARPGAAFSRRLPETRASRLDLRALAQESSSLKVFIQARAKACGLLERLDPALPTADFLTTLAQRMQGNFLAARCAIDALASSPGMVNKAALQRLPAELAQHYRDFLRRLPPHLLDAWPDVCGLLLGSLAAARAPLGEKELAVITGLRRGKIRDLLTRLKGYLQCDDGDWRIFHASFAEFLLDKEKAEEFWCPEVEQHERFISWILGAGNWAAVPAYGLINFVGHVLVSELKAQPERLRRACEPDFVAARLAHVDAAFGIASDFRLALSAASQRGDVSQALFLTLLLGLWQDCAGAAAAAPSTALLACLGRVEQASALALRQDAAGHSERYESDHARSSFASRLISIGESDAAIRFALQAEAEGDMHASHAVLEALAIYSPRRAMVLIGEAWPFRQPLPTLSAAACRGLAVLPEGVAIALARRNQDDSRALIDIAEACAEHDLDRALALVSQGSFNAQWLGGEHLVMSSTRVACRVMIAHARRHPALAQRVWQRTFTALPGGWPNPYGFLLAAALAAGDSAFAKSAFERLDLSSYGVQRHLAAAWIDAQSGSTLLKDLPAPEDSEDRVAARLMAAVGLREALQMLALIELEALPRAGEVFETMKRVGNAMLRALGRQEEIPERRSDGARVLGRFFGWLGADFALRLRQLGKAHWRSEGWRHKFAEGLSLSLAHQDVDSYLAARADTFTELQSQSATNLAADILARRDPREVLRLIDSVPVKYSGTRAELVGIAAIAFRQTGQSTWLLELPSRLSAYPQSAVFREVAIQLRAALDNARDDREPSRLALVFERAQYAIADGDAPALAQAAEEVGAFSQSVGELYRGQTIWPEHIRRLLAKALAPQDPARALALLLPLASLDEVRALAREIRARLNTGMADELALRVQRIGVEAEPSMQNATWQRQLVLAFALELQNGERSSFFDTLNAPAQLKLDVAEALDAIADPRLTLERLSGRSDEFYMPWIAGHALAAVCRTEAALAFHALASLDLNGPLEQSLLQIIAENWPLDSWRAGIANALAWADPARHGKTFRISDFLETLLARVGAFEPVAAMDALDRAIVALEPGTLYRSQIQKAIINTAVEADPTPAQQWPLLVACAVAIEDSGLQSRALHSLLAALPRLLPGDRARCTVLTFAAFGQGPAEPVLQGAEAMIYAALSAEPALKNQGEMLVARLAALLAELQASAFVVAQSGAYVRPDIVLVAQQAT